MSSQHQPQPQHQQRLEGPVLEDLLTEVRERFGADVTIVEANCLRRGGVAGFFAKERFEVVVEVPEGVIDVRVDGPEATTDEPAPAPAAPTSLLGWADQVSDGEVEETRVSTQGDRFAEVLARIAHTTESAALPESDPDAPFEVWTAATLPAVDKSGAPVKETAAADDEPEDEVTPASPGASPPAVPAPPAPPAPVHAYPSSPPARRPMAPAVPAAPSSAPPASAPAPVQATALVRPDGLDLSPLVRAGIPADLVARVDDAVDLPHALLRALENLPQPRPLPDLPGAVIAVVGEREAAMDLCGRLAVQLDISPSKVLLASARYRGRAVSSDRRIDSLAAASERRLAWRRRARPVIVAIDASPGAKNSRWASNMVDALEAAMTWATVEAARKPEDIEAWVASLGGVDALGVTGVDETTSPAAVLHTGMPVGWIDDDLATASRWAAVITDRIAA